MYFVNVMTILQYSKNKVCYWLLVVILLTLLGGNFVSSINILKIKQASAG